MWSQPSIRRSFTDEQNWSKRFCSDFILSSRWVRLPCFPYLFHLHLLDFFSSSNRWRPELSSNPSPHPMALFGYSFRQKVFLVPKNSDLQTRPGVASLSLRRWPRKDPITNGAWSFISLILALEEGSNRKWACRLKLWILGGNPNICGRRSHVGKAILLLSFCYKSHYLWWKIPSYFVFVK